ncbi:MAG: hypothetical protein COA85_07725 [Robiginitomaculum sp.]|nr:MAG: hypothetical protein COA85_07725 [Robiginitomaculum sp.]
MTSQSQSQTQSQTLSENAQAQSSGDARKPLHSTTIFMLTLAGLWLILGGAGIAMNAFGTINSEPPKLLMGMILTPSLFILLAYGLSKAFRRWVAGLDLALLTVMHATRTIGFAFIVMWYYGTVTAVFAFAAGLGDIAVAVMAPFVALALARKTPGALKLAKRLHMAGTFDFFVAVALGASSLGVPVAQMNQIDQINIFPLGIIPAMGVPFLLAIHMLAFLNLRTARLT